MKQGGPKSNKEAAISLESDQNNFSYFVYLYFKQDLYSYL